MTKPVALDAHTAFDIGVGAYIYLYPLVLTEVTRRQATNVSVAAAGDNH